MEKINHENQLIERLKADIDNCGKETIVLLGGHFPLVYLDEAVESIRKWGEFSVYSLELACRAGRHARANGKEVKFVFFVDDHAYESLASYGAKSAGARRKRLYRNKSGLSAKLHPIFQATLEAHGFSAEDVIRHNHGKNGREDCLYFSEKILRASARGIENACAREYTEFIENPEYFNKEESHMVAFVPNRCRGHICEVALDQEIEGLSASHVFIETMIPLASREELYTEGRGVTLRTEVQTQTTERRLKEK